MNKVRNYTQNRTRRGEERSDKSQEINYKLTATTKGGSKRVTFFETEEAANRFADKIRGDFAGVTVEKYESPTFEKQEFRNCGFRLNKDSDRDIIAYLESKGNISEYLRELIRKDMEVKQ